MDMLRSVTLGGLTSLLLALWGTAPAEGAFSAFTLEGSETTHPPCADGTRQESPFITALALNGSSIKVDGKLDEAVWANAQCGRGFRRWDPDRGGDVSEHTVFKVAYDQDAIYFAVACLENDVNNVTSNLARRDRFSYSDVVSIYIDPYFDKTSGYNFKINPEGVQLDAYISNDGDWFDDSWDAVWEAETFMDEDGWYTEVKIPFSSIRYRPRDEMTWGLQVYRYMHGRGEDTAWKIWDREVNGFVSQFGELRGLRDVPAPRQVEIMPYALGRSLNQSIAGDEDNVENDLNWGADLKYGMTADLTLNATVLPDFGQVEADPSELNLSPFETYFNEKRPFFIEGNQYFSHPDFNLFYSRRVGTDQQGARIRSAAKLTGKTRSGVSLGLLAATTDGKPDARWNLFETGSRPKSFLVSRVGKEFNDGQQKFNLMSTYTKSHKDGEFEGRDAYTGGMDFDLFFKDRMYNIQASTVFSNIVRDGESGVWGTGGNIDVRKVGGNWRVGTWGRWEGDRLQLNDAGFLSAPDQIETGGWASWDYNPEGESDLFNRAQSNFNFWRGWLYGARSGYHDDTDELVWSYGKGYPVYMGGNVNGWMQFKNYYEAWYGLEMMAEGQQRWETRGGPLISEPATNGAWWGVGSDSRKPFRWELEGNYYYDVEDNRTYFVELDGRWNMSSSMTHELSVGYRNRLDDTQYISTVDLSEHPGGQGIGGLSYVFGKIDQETLVVTWRSSILFSRDQSLDLYLQPFLTVGDYSNVRELAHPNSYDLVDYDGDIVVGEDDEGNDVLGDPADRDFNYVAANLNLVYRWEFRPGSTFYLVWAHSRESFENRHGAMQGFNPNLDTGELFSNEPTNTFMTKVTYWFNL